MKRIILDLLFVLAVVSCDKISESVSRDIQGSFYRTIVWSGGVQRMNYTFNDDMTGSWYSSGRVEQWAHFTYSISRNRITCIGAYGNSSGKVSEYTNELIYADDCVYSKNLDDCYGREEIVVDESGREIPDLSDMIYNSVWRYDDRIWYFDDSDNMYDYFLYEDSNDEYFACAKRSYSYERLYGILNIGTSRCEIYALNETFMSLKIPGASSPAYLYRAEFNDLPSTINLYGCLTSASYWRSDWNWNSKRYLCYFDFDKDGSVTYGEHSNVMVGSYGHATLSAEGTFMLSGDKIICEFTDVSWPGGYMEKYRNIFPGWEYDKPCVKSYELFTEDTQELVITDSSGKKLTLVRSI